MKILGIETSCDETAAAVVDGNRILSNIVASQDDVHLPYGGVVPELASRRHLENIVPVIEQALTIASTSLDQIEGIAVTSRPGLVGSLLVGISAAKGLSFARGIPMIGVNHLEGHLNAVHLEHEEVPYPYVALVVSGGHTSLYHVTAFGCYRLLGATRDDAAGEAFDKVAKLFGLGFPGGPAVDRIASQGNPKAFRFTVPKFDDEETLAFSFSGIKTAVALMVRNNPNIVIADVAASFQYTVVNVLVDRLFAAAERYHAKAVVISGGVAANRLLRREVAEQSTTFGLPAFIPSAKLCTDNAAMIAYVGERYLALGARSDFTLNAVATQEIGVG